MHSTLLLAPDRHTRRRELRVLEQQASSNKTRLLVESPAQVCFYREFCLRLSAWLHRKDTKKQRPRFYRVMLHNDNYNRREYVVQVLLKVIPGMTVDDAVNVMQARCYNILFT